MHWEEARALQPKQSKKEVLPETSLAAPKDLAVDRPARMTALNVPWNASYQTTVWDGSKYPGGLGVAQWLAPDYWTLRARSAAAFSKNMYARGLIRRLVTNVINTGLELNALPNEVALGMEQGSLSETTDMVEALFTLWGNTPAVCDYLKSDTFGEIQKIIYREGLIEGDVLVIANIDERTGAPTIRVVGGSSVQTPGKMPKGKRIEDGVELDRAGRHVAYWVQEVRPVPNLTTRQQLGQIKDVRIPAYGAKSGRRTAWLYYGTDKRATATRGEPLLGIVLQSLAGLEQYRDAVVLKAVLNAILVASVEREHDGVPTLPVTGGARKKKELPTVEDDSNSARRDFRLDLVPGVIMEQLAKGEKLKMIPNTGTDEKMGGFESATIRAIAWINEIPPDVLELSFQNNFSASKGAQAEGFVFLRKERKRFGRQNNDRVYDLFLEGSLLAGDFEAPGFLEAPRDDYKIRSAWLQAEWQAPVKPIGDLGKEVKAYAEAVKENFTTRQDACQALFGQKFLNVAQQQERERQILGIENEVVNDDLAD